MAVREVVVESVEPYEDGRSWGAHGPYEVVRGVARGRVDPDAPGNRTIVDIDLAERAPDGTVAYETDVCVLRPVATGASRRLLMVVPNRGMAGGVPMSVGAAGWGAVGSRIDPGDGLVLRRGWSVGWCGWQWDVPRAAGLFGLAAPSAVDDRGPIQGTVRVEFRSDAPIAHHRLGDAVPVVRFTPYPAARLDDPEAVLTVRDWPEGPRRTIDRARWRFARDEGGRPVDDDTHVWLEGGFEPHRFYEVVYTTSRCPVVGVGLLALRDVTSFLRAAPPGAPSLCPEGLDHVVAFGASQSGRVLRQFLHEGLNVDDDGRTVFDGVLAHIAGARRGEFNHRYGQPSVTWVHGFGNLPPFAPDAPGGGLLDRQRERGGVPRTMFTNSSWEYWRGDAALGHIDPVAGCDLPEAPEVRHYLFAGIDHVGDAVAMKAALPLANPVNPLGPGLLLRAAFVNLEAWVCDDVRPPESQVPRLADGSAVHREEVLARVATIPGAHLPDPAVMHTTRPVDLGPQADRGVGRWPVVLGDPCPAYVAAVDDDGNETAGVRLPDLEVPVATYTGWNPRRVDPGLPAVLQEFAGSAFAFAPTTEEQERRGDPRPSLEARYRDRAEVLDRVQAAAAALVARRLLLAEDEPRAVETAMARFDA